MYKIIGLAVAMLLNLTQGKKVTGTCRPTQDGVKNFGLTYRIVCPYDLRVEDRYEIFENNKTHHMWVMSDDLSLSPKSDTMPRTEIAFLDDVYNSGISEFSGDFYVPKKSSGFTIF